MSPYSKVCVCVCVVHVAAAHVYVLRDCFEA